MSSCDKNSNQTFDVSKLKVSSETDQIMIVVPESYTSYSAKFYYYIKNKDEKWDEIINSDAHIGKNGLGKEKEGDLKTPVGKYKFNYYFGMADNPGTKMPYVKLTDSHWWNCDSNTKEYNTMINTDEYGHNFDKSPSEHMIEYDLAYQYGMNINYNEEAIPGKGSAIFLHCFTLNPFSFGCIAIPKEDMIKAMININENCVIIIDEKKNIYNY